MNSKICTLLFLIEGENILLAMKKRGFGSNRWNGVGGKVEQGETLEAAMIRETQEEIGVTPLEYEYVGYLEFNFPNGITDMRVHAYLASAWDGEPIETEEMAPRWFKIKEIPYDNMWQDDKYWLPKVLEGKSIKGVFTFDEQENMLTHSVVES